MNGRKQSSEFTRRFQHEFVLDMLRAMPEEKKRTLSNALDRTAYLTSWYGFSLQHVEVYKEGWYIVFEGCRSTFKMWVGDNDGEFVYGKRKPTEDKLSFLFSHGENVEGREFVEILGVETI